MITKFLLITVSMAAFGIAGTAMADNKNWTEEKQEQVETNRQSNCGYGAGNNQAHDWLPADHFTNLGEQLNTTDGIEKSKKNGTGATTELGNDLDPGNSGTSGNCQPGSGSNPV